MANPIRQDDIERWKRGDADHQLAAREVERLRSANEQQAQTIEMLERQVDRLTKKLESRDLMDDIRESLNQSR